jgi:hypothetical protein
MLLICFQRKKAEREKERKGNGMKQEKRRGNEKTHLGPIYFQANRWEECHDLPRGARI